MTSKATFKVIKLHFNSPLHISDNRSDYGVSLRTIQSDTLYAAVISCLAKLGISIPEDGDLGCTVSSLFPFYQKTMESKAVYFFPRPLKMQLPTTVNAKEIKKIQWVDLGYFQIIINGESDVFNNISDIKNVYLTSSSLSSVNGKGTYDFITSTVVPRVKVSRSFEDAEPFYMDRVSFADKSGLFFVVVGDTYLLEKGLELLQYEGIGTDRNVGNGYFDYTTDDIEIEIPDNANAAVGLSMFIPASKDQLDELINGENIAYDFTRRGGWITDPPYNTFRKNAIYSFLPGSVYSSKKRDIEVSGKIVNLCPDVDKDVFENKKIEVLSHPIWRCGRSIFIPIII